MVGRVRGGHSLADHQNPLNLPGVRYELAFFFHLLFLFFIFTFCFYFKFSPFEEAGSVFWWGREFRECWSQSSSRCLPRSALAGWSCSRRCWSEREASRSRWQSCRQTVIINHFESSSKNLNLRWQKLFRIFILFFCEPRQVLQFNLLEMDIICLLWLTDWLWNGLRMRCQLPPKS